MIKSYGKIECFNDEKGVKHILSETELVGCAGKNSLQLEIITEERTIFFAEI